MKVLIIILLILMMIELFGRIGYDGYGDYKYKNGNVLIDWDEFRHTIK